jgi:hypothetical protein
MTKTKGKLKKKAIVAIARKLSQFMFAILKSAQPYPPVHSETVINEKYFPG